MNIRTILFLLFLCSGCASLNLVNQNINPELPAVALKNVLVIGVTPDEDLRKEFEFKFVKKLNEYNINALQSSVVFKTSFKNAAQFESDILAQIALLKSKGYDAVLVTSVNGIDRFQSRSGEHVKFDYYLRRFSAYYAVFSKADYDKNKDADYRVLNLQTSIYSLNSHPEMTLVWSGFYDLINPDTSSKTIDKYIKAVCRSLEKKRLILKE
ncbi:hypothetical protein MWU59_09525 [Flavobacteriaceae bacterium F08102]|nr:hypothetical protein [Flavobacteriaceae bacterium F08102]